MNTQFDQWESGLQTSWGSGARGDGGYAPGGGHNSGGGGSGSLKNTSSCETVEVIYNCPVDLGDLYGFTGVAVTKDQSGNLNFWDNNGSANELFNDYLAWGCQGPAGGLHPRSSGCESVCAALATILGEEYRVQNKGEYQSNICWRFRKNAKRLVFVYVNEFDNWSIYHGPSEWNSRAGGKYKGSVSRRYLKSNAERGKMLYYDTPVPGVVNKTQAQILLSNDLNFDQNPPDPYCLSQISTDDSVNKLVAYRTRIGLDTSDALKWHLGRLHSKVNGLEVADSLAVKAGNIIMGADVSSLNCRVSAIQRARASLPTETNWR